MFPGRSREGQAERESGRRGCGDTQAPESTWLFLSVPQDMLPMPGDPTQGTGNYNIEDFADLGMFPPFSE